MSSPHYFEAQPRAAHRPGTVRVVLPDIYLELETDSGVFSPGRLDPGTRLLLEAGPKPPPGGDLLDLGCGYGPVACALASRAPAATVWAVDVNERALALCARNAAKAGLDNVRCATPSAPDIPRQFAGIWSNPPVRIGKAPLHDMLRTWLGRLAPGSASPGEDNPPAPPRQSGRAGPGEDNPPAPPRQSARACLVMGRNLGADSLHAWLAGQGWPVTRLAARSGYRLLLVEHRDIDHSERAGVTPP